MKIQRLTVTDAQAFFEVRLTGLREFPEAFGESVEEFEQRNIRDIANLFSAGEATGDFVFGAFDKTLVGVVGFRKQAQSKTCHTGVLWGMYVLPEARRKGVAKSLVGALVSYARSIPQVEQIKLAVESTNVPAISLYKSVGFQQYGVEPRALKVNGQYYAEEHMMLRL